MHIHELKPAAPPEPPPAWRLQFEQFWREATDLQRIDMRVTLEMGDGAGAQRLLESWQQELAERRKKRNKKQKTKSRRFRYGVYGGWFYPGFHNNSGSDASTDGADGGGGESIQEQAESDSDVIERFAASCAEFLALQNPPRIRLRRDPEWCRRNGTFGRYTADPHNHIELATAGRHIIDVLRTLAHEMTHAAQNERTGLPADAGETGSRFEDSANAMAGRIMRHWAESEPDLFQGVELEEGWRERAAGVAAAACVAGTPGCATTGITAADALSTIQTVGRAAQNLPTRAGAEEELRQELGRIINRGRGTHAEPRMRESSGYIPTAAEKNDPRFSTALTKDVRPGETGRQANRLGLKTDSQGRPRLLMKRLESLLEQVKLDEKCWDTHRQVGMKKKGDRMVPDCRPKESIEEDQELTEVDMNPGTFRRFLASPEAEGIRAGFEAELIFRDAQSDESYESEPDYDADQRTRSISDIIDFFTGGDNGITGRQARSLENDLTEQFSDWVTESFDDDYFTLSRFQEWAEDVIWPEVEDQYRDHARENLDDPDASDEDIEKEAIALFRDDVERNWDRRDQWHDRAREELYDEYAADQDESDWLESQGLRYMSDIADQWNLDWPYWTEGGSGGGGREWADIGASLEGATGLPVRVGTGYHSMRRRPGEYVIEPDSSLDPDDGTDFGLEVVSPPLPLFEALEQLRRVIDWANGAGNAYTNSSTGLHMGVSLPYKGGDVDPIKLILFMGDRNILETFGRESNTYARSAMERLQSKVSDMRNAGPQQISGIMNLMRKSLIELADRDLKKGVLGQKYVSVNPHDGYIEFRGPGGDYLAREDEIDDVLENTMMRLAYAMHIAGRPDLYRDEYAKKLYRVLTGYRGAETTKSGRDTRYRTEIETETDDPFMRLFADYSAGTLSGPELKRKWADAVLAAEKPKPAPGASDYARLTTEYEVFNRKTGEVLDTFRAHDDNDAVDRALNKYSGQSIDFGVRRKSAEKKPASRRAELAKRVLDRPLVWRVEDTNDGRVILVRASDRDSARREARRIDPGFNHLHHNDPDSFLVKAATAAETQQYVQQRADAQADSQELQARLGAPASASDPNALAPGERDWLVRWSEYRDRDGREELVHDSLRTVARTAADASSRLIDTLAMQGRVAFNVRSEPTAPPEWRRNQELSGGAPGARIVNDPRDPEPVATSNITNALPQNSDIGPPRANTTSDSNANWGIIRRDSGNILRGFTADSEQAALDEFRTWTKERIGNPRNYQLVPLENAIPGSTLDIQRQRQQAASQPQAEFSGRWQIRNASTGDVLQTISGIGNVQADANRSAREWAQRNGVAHIPLEVVPEMR